MREYETFKSSIGSNNLLSLKQHNLVFLLKILVNFFFLTTASFQSGRYLPEGSALSWFGSGLHDCSIVRIPDRSAPFSLSHLLQHGLLYSVMRPSRARRCLLGRREVLISMCKVLTCSKLSGSYTVVSVVWSLSLQVPSHCIVRKRG